MKRLLTTLTLLAITAPAIAEERYSLTTGFDYSTGKYGNAVSTDILYIPVIGQYEADKLMLKLTVPYISVTGPGGVIQGMGRIRAANSRTTTTSNSGLGDIIASAGYNVYSVNAYTFDVVGTVKLGTANETHGLGTGQNDYSAQIDGYYAFDRKITFFATAGYRFYGSPAGVDLNSAPYETIGINQKLGDVTSAGAMLDVAQSPISSGSDKQEVTAFITQMISPRFKFQANVRKGFSDGSPDYGGGVMITGYL